MKRTRVIAILAAGTVVASALAACSGGSSDGGKDGSDGPVTISIMEFKQTRIDAVGKLIPGFEAEMKKQGKDIKVKLVADILTDDQFKTKVTQQLIAKQAPDLIDIGDSLVPGWAGAGYLAPMDDYLKDWDGWDHYYPQIKKAMVRQDGNIYALAHETGVQNLFYRKDAARPSSASTPPSRPPGTISSRASSRSRTKTGGTPIVIPAGTAWGGGTLDRRLPAHPRRYRQELLHASRPASGTSRAAA